MTISATSQGLKPGVCTSSNRPANPFDGMMIYETDTNLVRIWNGSSWKTLSYSDYSSGSVIQVASTTKTDTFSTSSSSFVDVTGLSVTITPTSTSSKVLVQSVIMGSAPGAAAVLHTQMVRDSTSIFIGDAASSRTRVSGAVFDSSTNAMVLPATHLDSPSSTSTITYKMQVKSSASGQTVWVNRTVTDTDTASYYRGASSITVMEIAG